MNEWRNPNSSAVRTAFTLTEMISVSMVLGFALGLVTHVFRTHLEVNRRLTVSATRAAAANSFVNRMRGDLLAASAFTVATSTTDDGIKITTVVITTSNSATTYAFHRVDRRESHAEGDPAIDQVIIRTDAGGEEHRWVLPAQMVIVEASPAAPSRILTLKFQQNGRSSPGFNRSENLEMSLLTGGTR